jgi:predicted nucleotidyltransferase component of viral defense system
MTQPNKPIDRQIEQDRPSDPFTAQDAARLFASIDGIKKEVMEKIGELEKRIIAVQGHAARIESSQSETRVGRLELELMEAEKDLEIAERNRRNLEEKINLKKEAVTHSADTNEKIKVVAVGAFADLEKQRREANAAKLYDLKWSAIKAGVNVLAGGAALGIVAFIWFLVQLFLNRGGP